MDKAIKRYLAKRGIHTTVTPMSERTFSERAPEFFAWFHQSVLGLDTEAYRREFWREAYRTGRTIGHVPYTLDDYLFKRRAAYSQGMFNLFVYSLFMGGSFAVWVMRRQIDKHIRRLKRPGYYEEELARRKKLAEERRKLRRRRTLNPCPTTDALNEAFAKAKDSPASMIRFGSLLEDLECYVDNSIMFDEYGNVAGRKGGIRRYLAENAPELFARYKTVMRYKALAKKFRQALGVKDPVPAAMLLPAEETFGQKEGASEIVKGRAKSDLGTASTSNSVVGVEMAKDEVEIVKREGCLEGNGEKCTEKSATPRECESREFTSVEISESVLERAKELLVGCEGTCLSLMAALEVRLNPDYAPKSDPSFTSGKNLDYAIIKGFARASGTKKMRMTQ